MSLRNLEHLRADRATPRFALAGLGVSRAPEDKQTGRHQKNRSSGSCASPCPYGDCPRSHLGGLSACGRRYRAYICSFNLRLSVSVTAFCHSTGGVQRLILASCLIRLRVAPGTHSWCATCNWYLRYLAVFGGGPVAAVLSIVWKRWRSICPSRQLSDAERGLFDDTRHTVSPTSSAISNPPVRSTARPTGRPRA
jgi:hypothetical protein